MSLVGERSAREDDPRFSAVGVTYALISSLLVLTVILLIWPTTTIAPSWALNMSDELRYVAIAAVGGAFASAFRSTASTAAGIDRTFRPGTGVVGRVVNMLLAIQAALVVYVFVRSFVVLPTTPVTALSPFGILVLGSAAGAFTDTLMPTLIARMQRNFGDANLERRIDSIASAVGAATLDSYQGRLFVAIHNDVGTSLLPESRPEASEAVLQMQPNRRYAATAWFAASDEAARFSEEVSIPNGNPAPHVAFVVVADSSASMTFSPGRNTFVFSPAESSQRMAFEFVTPVAEAPFTLWFRASQKGRLVSVLAITADVRFTEASSPPAT